MGRKSGRGERREGGPMAGWKAEGNVYTDARQWCILSMGLGKKESEVKAMVYECMCERERERERKRKRESANAGNGSLRSAGTATCEPFPPACAHAAQPQAPPPPIEDGPHSVSSVKSAVCEKALCGGGYQDREKKYGEGEKKV